MSQSFLSRLPLSRFEVDRDHLARERPALFDELRGDQATRVLPIFNGKTLVKSESELALLPFSDLPEASVLVYLGRTITATESEPIGTPVVAALLDEPGSLADGSWASLRSVGSRLSNRDAGLATEALGILNWHQSHRFAPGTGAPTEVVKGGWVRRDPVAGTEHFPRTDAAIIVGVTDSEDRILLGSNAAWESNRFSLLAGFVEPGESLEAAVIREVFEESGVHVTDPRYLGSQPWPFPASLMLGFTASLDSARVNTLNPDGTEILALRWFSRDELRSSRGDILLPGSPSIAHAILEEWLGEPLTEGLW